MRFERVDHAPFCEFLGYWEETINRWYKEGLPTWITLSASGPSEFTGPGLCGSRSLSGVYAVADYFGLEKKTRLGIDFAPIPRFTNVVLEDTDRYRIDIDEAGIKRKILKQGTTIPGYIEHPVKSAEDFRKIKERFNPKDPRRYPKNWSDEQIEFLRNLDVSVGLVFPGFFGQGRTFMGQREFLLAFYKSPKLIHEIFEFWENFLEETMEEVANAKVLDYVVYWEDMCYKNGPQISPRHFEEFMLPYYKRFSNWIRRKGIDTIMVDTDGDANPIVDQFLEGGVNCMFPLEVASYMDVVELRKKYGKRLSLIGNIDKMAIAKGKTAIDRELDRKIPLTREGGFLPCVDHNVSPDISLKNYTYYVQSLKEHLSIK
jgi:hypothetical protein